MIFLIILQISIAIVVSKEVANGKCPFRPGQIKSNVSSDLDLKKILGPWMIIYDEKELTNNFLCLSANLSVIDEGKPNELKLQQANTIYEITRMALKEQGAEKVAEQKYFINPDRKAVFQNVGSEDKSSAYIKKIDKTHIDQGNKQYKMKQDLFENQFLKYFQILDTDYDNFMLVYTCQEFAEFSNEKTGLEISAEDVFRAYINQKGSQEDLESIDMSSLDKYYTLKGIKIDYVVHKQKIQIYTRPQYVKDTNEFKYKEYDNMMISQLLNDVTKHYLPVDFDQNVFDFQYSKQVHDKNCDYNPFDNQDYYIKDEIFEEEEQVQEKIQEQNIEHDEL